jgi:hypothetical protein
MIPFLSGSKQTQQTQPQTHTQPQTQETTNTEQPPRGTAMSGVTSFFTSKMRKVQEVLGTAPITEDPAHVKEVKQVSTFHLKFFFSDPSIIY